MCTADADDSDSAALIGTAADDNVPIDTELSDYIDVEGGRMADYSVTSSEADLLADSSLHGTELPRVSSAVSRSVAVSRSAFALSLSVSVCLSACS